MSIHTERGKRTGLPRPGSWILGLAILLSAASVPSAAQPGGGDGAPSAGAAVAVSLEHMEAAQSIQDGGQSVPLLAGRGTLVRVYLRPSAGQPVAVRGTLQATSRGTGAVTQYPSDNEIGLHGLPATLAAMRADLSRSLNFLLPATAVNAGDTLDVALVAVSGPGSTAVACTNCQQRALPVAPSPPMRLVLVGLRYRDPFMNLEFSPGTRDFDMLESWIRRAFPVGELHVSRRVVDIPDAPRFSCDTANVRLAAIRTSDIGAGADLRTRYYGLVSDERFFMRGCAAGIPPVPNPTVVASGPAGDNEYPWDTDGSYADWYGGHEIAHTLGRSHIGACKQTREDTLYPYDGGRISSPPATFLGWDAGEPASAPDAVLPGEVWHDVMSYCPNQWVSDYTYAAIRERLIAEDALPAHADPGGAPGGSGEGAGGMMPAAIGSAAPGAAAEAQDTRYAEVIAVVNLTRETGSIQEVVPADPRMAGPPIPDGRASIRVIDASGATVGTYPVWLRESTDREPPDPAGVPLDRTATVQEVIPLPENAVRVDLLLGGRVLDSQRAGRNAPALQVVDVESGSTPPGAPITFTWRARDPDAADRLTFTVRVLFEGSTEWETFATGLTEREISFDQEQLMGRRINQLEISASDGLRVDEIRVVSPP